MGIRKTLVVIVLLFSTEIFGENATHTEDISKTDEITAATKNSVSLMDKSKSSAQSVVPLAAVTNPNQSTTPSTSINSNNFTRLIRLEDVLTVFDLNELAYKWPNIKNQFKSNCANDMTEYFQGLRQHKSWAIKSK